MLDCTEMLNIHQCSEEQKIPVETTREYSGATRDTLQVEAELTTDSINRISPCADRTICMVIDFAEMCLYWHSLALYEQSIVIGFFSYHS